MKNLKKSRQPERRQHIALLINWMTFDIKWNSFEFRVQNFKFIYLWPCFGVPHTMTAMRHRKLKQYYVLLLFNFDWKFVLCTTLNFSPNNWTLWFADSHTDSMKEDSSIVRLLSLTTFFQTHRQRLLFFLSQHHSFSFTSHWRTIWFRRHTEKKTIQIVTYALYS